MAKPRTKTRKKPPAKPRKTAPKPTATPTAAPPPEPPRPPPAAIVELGVPPDDPLEVQAYLCKALAISAHDAMTDEKLTPDQRRRELRTISAAASKLVPKSRLFEAEQIIKGDRAELERLRSGATLEPAPPRKPSGAGS